jgi:hypothetical protein
MRWKQPTHHIINADYYQWHILKPGGKSKAKGSFTIYVKTPNRTEEKSNLKGTTEWLVSIILQDKNEPSCLHANKPYESMPL